MNAMSIQGSREEDAGLPSRGSTNLARIRNVENVGRRRGNRENETVSKIHELMVDRLCSKGLRLRPISEYMVDFREIPNDLNIYKNQPIP